MLKIGITGGIGSGKTTVAKVFETLGIPVYYADDEAKRIMNEDEELKKKIIAIFGDESYENGKLNRAYLASIVFNDSYKLDLLNSFVHPATIKDAEQWMQNKKAPYALKEAALLFESGAAKNSDYVIGVTAPKHLRIKRVMERDKATRDEVLKRINRQIEEDIKMKLCDFLIVNDEQQPVIPQVLTLHEKLLTLTQKTGNE
jgi:dephospho-CoA kinase